MVDDFIFVGELGKFYRPQIRLMQEEYVQRRAIAYPGYIIFFVNVDEDVDI